MNSSPLQTDPPTAFSNSFNSTHLHHKASERKQLQTVSERKQLQTVASSYLNEVDPTVCNCLRSETL